MAYTKFGEFARILRIKHHEVMGDMAARLGVSTAFLSSVENGKRNVPESWTKKIPELYGLSKDEVYEMNKAIEASKVRIKLDLTNTSETKRLMALQVARSFDNISEETAQKITRLLEGKDK